jgi:pilus assembly protein CpaB
LLGVSAVCAAAAASLVNGYADEIETRVGPLVQVAVASTEIPRGRLLTPASLRTHVVHRWIPQRFVPPDAYHSAREALGLRAAVRIPAGGYLDRGRLRLPRPRSAGLARAGRARIVEVPVTGGGALGGIGGRGATVDVLVTSESGAAAGRTYLALQRVELLSVRSNGGDAAAEGRRGPDTIATLRVSLRQAVLLTAAENFARELRLVARPAGDRRLLGTAAVGAEELRP